MRALKRAPLDCRKFSITPVKGGIQEDLGGNEHDFVLFEPIFIPFAHNQADFDLIAVFLLDCDQDFLHFYLRRLAPVAVMKIPCLF
jgi:hypothetical protein